MKAIFPSLGLLLFLLLFAATEQGAATHPLHAARPILTPTPAAAYLPAVARDWTFAPPAAVTQTARLRNAPTKVYAGPSSVYTPTAILLGSDVRLQLTGRTARGDWVYAHSLWDEGEFFWVRRAYVTITGNSLPPGAPPDADPNDPRWLPVRQPDAGLLPRPVPTPIPAGDFPLPRYDAGNRGRVPALPQGPLRPAWWNLQQAGGAFLSPPAVLGEGVLAASADGNLYNLTRPQGVQRWRFQLPETSPLAPAAQDGVIYLPSGAAGLRAVRDGGNVGDPVWETSLPATVTTPAMVWLDTLFVGAGEGDAAQLVALDRNNPDNRRSFALPAARVQLPAVGGETVFVGADRLWALDANLLETGEEIVWTSPDVFTVTVPPVYAAPGVVRLAELYAADTDGVVHALDANTGVHFWSHSTGEGVTALAANASRIFVGGESGLLRALARRDGSPQWSRTLSASLVGAMLVTDALVLAVTEDGKLWVLDAGDGSVLDAGAVLPVQPVGGPATDGVRIFVPGVDGSLYAFEAAP